MKHLFSGKYLFILLSLFLFVRLINVTAIPIFNDESIYLAWGWRETHIPGMLFYSLIDAKQPFLMWIFGISESFIRDPLFAGRFVSIIAGALTLWGIYKVSLKYFNSNIAILSSLFYIVIPFFSFYDRQALMESALGAIGVWVLYFALQYFEEKKTNDIVRLGIILGIGYFIKSTAILFLFAFLILYLYCWKIDKNKYVIRHFIVFAGSFFAVTALLLIQPMYWQTFSSNSRYVRGLGDLLQFPVIQIFQSIVQNIFFMTVLITPILFIFGIIGTVANIQSKNINYKYISLYFLLSFVIDLIFVKGPNPRYLVSILPIITVLAAAGFFQAFSKSKKISIFILAIGIVTASFLTLIQLFVPIEYFRTIANMSVPQTEYYKTFTSGYGVSEAVQYIQSHSSNRTIVTYALNTGNPENAMEIYFRDNDKIHTANLDSQMFNSDISEYSCFSYPGKLFFVSRDAQQANMNRFFEKVTDFKNPYSDYSIGIYTLKHYCQGKTIPLQF